VGVPRGGDRYKLLATSYTLLATSFSTLYTLVQVVG